MENKFQSNKQNPASKNWIKSTTILACLALIVFIIFTFSKNNKNVAILDVNYPKAYADIDEKREFINENPVDDEFLNAVNNFSYKTASQILSASNENSNYSPISLYYALSVVSSGAKGETVNELLSLLGISDQEKLSAECKKLFSQLYTDNKIGQLKIANSLWLDDQATFKKGFIKNAAENFYATSHKVDFKNSDTGKAMAKWVSDNTKGTITPEFEANPNQILSILNTIYFYDQWSDKFYEDNTQNDLFYLPDGSTVNYDFMNQTKNCADFTQGNGFSRASLGLKNGGKMVFILPDEGVSTKELLSTPEKLKSTFESGEENFVRVVWKIPKFNFGSKFDLVDNLKILGLKSCFEDSANFSGITDQSSYINNIRQETHVGIDENGVEASAFTEIQLEGTSFVEDSKDMILNRPFIYAITANNGVLLFVGVCENPVAK